MASRWQGTTEQRDLGDGPPTWPCEGLCGGEFTADQLDKHDRCPACADPAPAPHRLTVKCAGCGAPTTHTYGLCRPCRHGSRLFA